MSERSVNLLEDISSSESDTVSMVPPALSPPLLISLKRKLLDREVTTVRWEIHRDQLKKLAFARRKLLRSQMKRTRTLMLFVALTRLESLGTSLRDSRSQKTFVERDLQRRVCPRVSLTLLTFHNVSFQIFNFY